MIKNLTFAVVMHFVGTIAFAHTPFDLFGTYPTPQLTEPHQMTISDRLAYYQTIFDNSAEPHATYIDSRQRPNQNQTKFNACWLPITADVKSTKQHRYCEAMHQQPLSRTQLWWIQKKLQAKWQLEMLSKKPDANYLQILEIVSSIIADSQEGQYWLLPTQQAHGVLMVMAQELN